MVNFAVHYQATANAPSQAYNAAIPGVLAARAAQGRHIVMVDLFAAIGTWSPANYKDSEHPNDSGYALMAQAGMLEGAWLAPELAFVCSLRRGEESGGGARSRNRHGEGEGKHARYRQRAWRRRSATRSATRGATPRIPPRPPRSGTARH